MAACVLENKNMDDYKSYQNECKTKIWDKVCDTSNVKIAQVISCSVNLLLFMGTICFSNPLSLALDYRCIFPIHQSADPVLACSNARPSCLWRHSISALTIFCLRPQTDVWLFFPRLIKNIWRTKYIKQIKSQAIGIHFVRTR